MPPRRPIPTEPDPVVTHQRVLTGIQHRVQQFPPDTVYKHPATVAHLVVSKIPHTLLHTVAPNLDAAWQYVAQKDAAGGQPAVLTNIRLAALGLPAPLQAQAHASIDALQKLTPDELQMALANMSPSQILGTPEGSTTVEQGAQALQVLTSPLAYAFGKVTNTMDDLLPGSPGTVVGKGFGIAGRALEEFVAIPEEAIATITGGDPHWGDTLKFWDLTKDEPLTIASFDISGEDINAPENQRLRSSLNFVSQFAGQVALGKVAGAFKDIVETPGGLRSPERWVDTRSGSRVFKTADEIFNRVPSARRVSALNDATHNIDPVLGKALADSWEYGGGVDNPVGATQAMKQTFIDYMNDPPSPARLSEVGAQIRSVQDRITSPDTVPDELPVLQAAETQLQGLLYTLTNKDGIYRWPERAAVQGVLKGGPPTSPFSRLVHTFYQAEDAHGYNPLKLVDNLPTTSPLWNPLDSGRPADWAAHNFDVVGRTLRGGGVPFADIQVLLGDMQKITSDQGFFEWSDRLGRALQDNARKNAPPELLHRLGHMFSTPVEGRTRAPLVEEATTADGRTVRAMHNVLETDSGAPLPTQESEFAGSTRTPNMNMVRDAASTIREWEQSTRVTAKLSNLVSQAWRTSTGIGKPIAVMTHAVPIFLKIQIDQALTNIFAGYKPIDVTGRLDAALRARGIDMSLGVPVDVAKARVYARDMLAESGASLGQVVSDFGVEPTTHVAMSTGEFMSRFEIGATTAAENTAIFNGLHYELEHLRMDESVRTLARYGPEATLQRMETPGTTLNAYYEQRLRPVLERAGVDALDFLKAKERQIEQVSGGDTALRESIYTGKWNYPVGAMDSSYIRDTATATSELTDITESIKNIRASGEDASLLPDLYRRRAEVLDMLDKRHPVKDYYALTDRGAFTSELMNRARDGSYDMPPRVLKEMPNSVLTGDAMDIHSTAIRKFTSLLYKGMKPMSWADLRLTRGSMYRQEFERAFVHLKDIGWTDAAAKASADARARFVVRDWMHDIANKSTLQRTVQNQFWFAPAWQKSFVRWLYKIPERMGGGFGAYSVPLGYAYLDNLVHDGSDMLKSLGVLRTTTNPDGTKQDLLMLPNPARIFDFIPGLQDMPNLVTMDPTQLNMVAREPLPGGSLGTSFVLGTAAKYAPIFKGLNDAVNAFGFRLPGVDTLTKAWEAATGTVPPWAIGESHKYQQYVVDRAHDRAIQYAYTDLANEGTVPPDPASFANAGLYSIARAAYWKDLDARAQQYFHGIGLTYLMGSVVGPTSYTPTKTEEAQWRKFLSDAGISGKRTDADYALIDKYLGDHPNSLAFNVGMFNYKGDPGASTASGFEAFRQAIVSGDLVPRNAQEFQARVALAQEWQYRDNATTIALNKAGLKNWDKLTPEQKLLRQGEYNAALAPVWKDWQGFLDHNPDAAKIYALYQSPASVTYDQIHQIEADRQDLISAGKDPDQMETKLYDALAKDTGYGTTDSEHIAWFKYHYMNEYYNQTNAIYDKIDAIKASGKPETQALLTAQYDALRTINNSMYGGINIEGDPYPSPEAYRYAKLQPADQLGKRTDWAQLPPQWLSNFQYETTYGKAPDEAILQYWKWQGAIEQEFADKTANLSSASNEYKAWKTWETNYLDSAAKKAGASAVAVRHLEIVTPGERLAAAGVLPDTPKMDYIVSSVRTIRDRLTHAGVTYYGSSADAEYYRGWLEGTIDLMRDPASKYYDPQVDKFWTVQANAIGMTNDHALYRLLLFGADSGFTIHTDYTAEDQTAKQTVRSVG